MIEWATHHKDDPPPPEDDENKEKRTDDIEPWDQEFLKVDQGTLFELILVSVVTSIRSTASLSLSFPLPPHQFSLFSCSPHILRPYKYLNYNIILH